MTRKKLIAANWKMFKTGPGANAGVLHRIFADGRNHSRDEIVVCPPFVDLRAAVEAASGSNVVASPSGTDIPAEADFVVDSHQPGAMVQLLSGPLQGSVEN